jgi:hypothetical protein
MLKIAIPFAATILARHKVKLQKHFSRYATRKYKCKPQQVKFKETAQLLRRVTLGVEGIDNLGETDGVSIQISDTAPMTFDELVGVLVHECLHNYCTVRGRFMSCYNEHICMRGLGDDCCA